MRLKYLIAFALLSMTALSFYTLNINVEEIKKAENHDKASSLNPVAKDETSRAYLAEKKEKEHKELTAAISDVDELSSALTSLSQHRNLLYDKIKNLKKLDKHDNNSYAILAEINDLDQKRIEINLELIKKLKLVTDNEY